MQFTKMHGAGNDYVYLDLHEETLPTEPHVLAQVLSDRHTGVGSDGLILIRPSEVADVRMQMYNADGSESEMCGNGLRCVAWYASQHGLVNGPDATVETGRGILRTSVLQSTSTTGIVRVEMGSPILQAEAIPVRHTDGPPLSVRVDVGDRNIDVCCVSMGNPHCVVFVPELTDELILELGPSLEHAEMFPERTNVELAVVEDNDHVSVRVWERGTGETNACGTGACAVVVAGALTNRVNRSATVHLRGGNLHVDWDENDNVFLTGPVALSFRGQWRDGT